MSDSAESLRVQGSSGHDLEDVAAVIANHNGWRLTTTCARRLVDDGLRPERVVVVDNASSDGSAAHLPRALPDAQVLANDTNVGFAAGCSAGAEQAWGGGAQAVLFINPDTAHAPGFVARLTGAVPDVSSACVAPEIFVMDRTQAPWFAGAWWGDVPGTFRQRRPGHANTLVDVLWACCMLIGREVWNSVGPFDETFFLFYEDMDWCVRAGRAGVTLRVAPDARLWHASAKSCGPQTRAAAATRRYHMSRSAVLFDRRWGLVLPSAGGWVRLAAMARTAAMLAFAGDTSQFRAHLQGLADGRRESLAQTDRGGDACPSPQ